MPRADRRLTDPALHGAVIPLRSLRGVEHDFGIPGLWKPNFCTECDGGGHIRTGETRIVCPHCEGTTYGPQRHPFLREEFEIFWGSARRIGKTEAGLAWMVSGNYYGEPVYPDGSPDMVNLSYTHSPFFRALVLRRNLNDLGDWITRAKRLYLRLGAQFVQTSPETGGPGFLFPTGATIICGHMDTIDAWEKYLGHEYQRILIEELAQCPTLKLYLLIRSSCTSSHLTGDPYHPGLVPRLFLSSNPAGRGVDWVRNRFVDARDENGIPISPLTTITDPITRKTRVFIRASIYDNPKYNPKYPNADKEYIGTLKDLALADPALERAMLYGDWSALAGNFFPEFRARGPLDGEPPEALHVIPPRPMLPWWPRIMAMDWGFAHEASVLWGCHAQDDRRLNIYREAVASDVIAEEWGVEIATRSIPDLERQDSVPLYLSSDAFDRRGADRSIVELLQAGVSRILGDALIHVPDLEADAVESRAREDGDYLSPGWREEFLRRSRKGITIIKSQKATAIGWQFVKHMLRWREFASSVAFSWEEADRVYKTLGEEEYLNYVRMFRDRKPDPLPRLQIHSCCPRLIDAVPKAARDPDNPETVCADHFRGKDSLDSLCYLLLGFRQMQVREPFESRRDRAVAAAKRRDPNITIGELIHIQRALEARKDADAPRPRRLVGFSEARRRPDLLPKPDPYIM